MPKISCRQCGATRKASSAQVARLADSTGPLCHPCRRSPEHREATRLREAARARERYAADLASSRERARLKHARRYALSSDAIKAGQHARGVPCGKCGELRAVTAQQRERAAAGHPPLCRKCRRAETDRLAALEAEFKVRRLANVTPSPLPPRSGRRAGRPGTGAARYRKNRIIVLSKSDVCGICGHGGSATVDHIVSDKHWPRDANHKRLPGFDDLENLQPAHGSLGGAGLVNRCPTCGRLCNQSRGARPLIR